MRAALAVVALLALCGSARAITDCATTISSNGGSHFLTGAVGELEAILGGAGSTTVTVFVPNDASLNVDLTSAQAYYGTIVADVQGNTGPFTSATADGTVLHSLHTDVNLGYTPQGSPVGTPGNPGNQVVKVRQISGAFYISGSPTQAPFKILSSIQCTTGYVHFYNASSNLVLTPPGNAHDVLHNLNHADFPPGGLNNFDAIVTAIDAVDGNTGAVWNQINSINGTAILLPTTAAITAFEARGGSGVTGYIFSAGGKQDVTSILLYHFLACPGETVLYTLAIYGAVSHGASNFTTILGAQVGLQEELSPPYPFPLEISLVNQATINSFHASSYAVQTTPQTIGGTANNAAVQVDIAFSGGVIHGLNGFLLPTAVQLTLDKVVGGLQSNAFGVSKFISYLQTAGLYAQLQVITTQNTLFVPSDAAFTAALAAFPLLGTNSSVLKSVLQLHIVPGIVATTIGYAGACPAGSYTSSYNNVAVVVGAVSGSTQPVSVSGGTSGHIQVAAVSVAQNGMVYPVDTVLVPSNVPRAATPTPTPTPTSAASTVTASFLAFVIAAVFAVFAA